jgi:hypothetical protein
MILFLDAVGGAYDGNSPHTGTLGGSELAQIQLAEALAERGKKVRFLTSKHFQGAPVEKINGVIYGGSVDTREVRTCILARMTGCPPGMDPAHTEIIVSLTDQGPHDFSPCHLLVGVSAWQINRFAALHTKTPRRVIPPIIETAPKSDKIPGRYIYAGAAMKGLDATLDAWEEAGKPGILEVCHGGWGISDDAQIARMSDMGVQYLGNLTPVCLRKRVSRASYLLGAKTYPETFCAVAAIAETCGTIPLLFSPHGKTGLDEAITTPVYYDHSKWLDAIKNPLQKCVYQNRFTSTKIAKLWEKIL